MHYGGGGFANAPGPEAYPVDANSQFMQMPSMPSFDNPDNIAWGRPDDKIPDGITRSDIVFGDFSDLTMI